MQPASFQTRGSQQKSLSIGHKNVAAAATPEVLSATATPCVELIIQAKQGNTGRVYIGNSSIANNNTGGVYLTAGQSLPLSPDFLNEIYLAVSVDGEGVTYMYW